MADILLAGVYDAAMRSFHTQGQGSERFERDFIDATNRSINYINRNADLETRIARIDATDDTVELDEDYEDVLFDGIVYHLLRAGQKPARGFERQIQHVWDVFVAGVSSIQTDLRNDLQDSQGSDDDTYDIIGLGALG